MDRAEEIVTTGLEIAVIGMAGRFPGARNIDEFWRNLTAGMESIRFFSDEELERAGISSELINDPGFVKSSGGVLEDIEYFDAAFFGYTPMEAEQIAPQIRLFHECLWESLEDAGYDVEKMDGLTGLYAGASSSLNWEKLCDYSSAAAELDTFVSRYLSNRDFISTLISYKLNLKGPGFFMHTACSTSLTAVHLASQGLLSSDCDMALAGGIALNLQDSIGYIYLEGMILSADGHCRTFDEVSSGTVVGEGVGVVVLKRLEDALTAGDHIYAVIKGSAINNDGNRKVGYTAPSVEGQVEVIRKALLMAEINPEDIGYIETHGTGTPLGDVTEVEALKLAFDTPKKHFCGLGAVKTNIGHLDTAAGITGLIKTVLAIKHRQVPPSLHSEMPNRRIDLEDSPFYIVRELRQWDNNGRPLRAGVSSFGIGGTNAHVVLEQCPEIREVERMKRGQGRGYQLILLSARTETALDKMTENFVRYLQVNPGANLADVSYTLQVGRRHFQHRRKLLCSNVSEAVAELTTLDSRNVQTHLLKSHKEEKSFIFMFPGLGEQYVNMGRGLYEKEPVFRREMDGCFKILKELVEYDLKEILYPPEKADFSNSSDQPEEGSKKINHFEVAQLVTFIFEYALARFLMEWGIQPRAMIGYSFGEYTAACLSGVFSLKHILGLLSARGRLIRELPEGMMLNVPLTAGEVQPLLSDELSIGIDNGASCVVSGPLAAVKAFEKSMKIEKVMCMPLDAAHALHSSMMDPIVESFALQVEAIPLNPPQIPYISTVTGTWIVPRDAVSSVYWCRQLRETVRFSRGIRELLEESGAILLEVGPGRELGALVNREKTNLPKRQEANTMESTGRDQRVMHLVRPHRVKKEIPDDYYLLDKIGLLWLYGASIDWPGYYAGESRHRVSLPTYPFERQRFWKLVDDFKAGKYSIIPEALRQNNAVSGELADWFYVPTWTRKKIVKADKEKTGQDTRAYWLVFMDEGGLGDGLLEQLKAANPDHIILVRKGQDFEKNNNWEYTINPRAYDHYRSLLEALERAGAIPRRIVHLWGMTAHRGEQHLGAEDRLEVIEDGFDHGFYSLLYLAGALGQTLHSAGKIVINVITDHMQEVTGEENLVPAKAAVLGPCRVIPQEYPHLTCRSIDITDWQHPGFMAQLLEELTTAVDEPVTAFRGSHRWVQAVQPLPLPLVGEAGQAPLLREQGVYLIIGGLGDIGFTLAEYLIKRVKARIILTGRSQLPPGETWGQVMIMADEKDKIFRDIQRIQQLRDLGGEVLYFQADVSDAPRMKEAVRQGEEQFGPINGIIHSAGIISGESFNSIADITGEQCNLQFRSKVGGLLVLAGLLKDKSLDFCLVISSICTVLGGLGFVAYAAANHFMDAFSIQYRKKRQEPWIIVDWDGTTPEDTARAFNHIFSLDVNEQVIFSNGGDLEGRISRWVKREGSEKLAEEETDRKDGAGEVAVLYSRPELSNPYVAPRNPLEQRLSGIWQRFFGIEKIGVTDDLYDLGGDSLKAINIISIIHKELEVAVPLKVFFDHSTIEGVARYMAGAGKQEYIPIVPVEKKDYYILSSAQRRLYILQEMEKESIAYNSPMVNELEGSLAIEEFEGIFLRLLDRHESFRTSIEMVEGEPVQRIHPPADVVFSIEYHEEASRTRAEQTVRDFVKPFELNRAPLFRVGLIKCEEQQHILMLDIHHIITDGITIDILFKDFSLIYQGKGNLLPALRLQYKDYSHWQKQFKDTILHQQDYWLNMFAGDVPVLNLPTDFPRPIVQGFAGSSWGFVLDAQETNALNQLAIDRETTLFVLLMALFNILLSRLSGQEDIVVGTPVVGRRHADLEEVIGIFINTLSIRNRPALGKAFMDFLREVKEQSLDAFENQEYPFEDIVEKAALKRDISRNPLFDVMLVMTYVPEASQLRTPGLQIKSYESKTRISKFDLTLHALESGDKLVFTFEYSTLLFKEERIQQFAEYFKHIISKVLTNPGIKISALEIISRQEKEEILYDFNDTAAEYRGEKIPGKNRLLHTLFEEQAEQTPDYIALTAPYRLPLPKSRESGGAVLPEESPGVKLYVPISLTYRQLNDLSGHLAGDLRKKGVHPGSVVGLTTESSLEMAMGIMAVLKAGGAYLPIDPAYPEERIDFMLKDSGINLLLTDSADFSENEIVSTVIDMAGICVDIDIESEGRKLLPAAWSCLPTEAAYVIYTSGTSGKPKGAVIQHDNVVNMLEYRKREYRLNSSHACLQLFSYAFDGFVTSFFTPVISGAKAVFPLGSEKRDITAVIKTIIQRQITHFICVPPLYRTIIEHLSPGEAAGLQVVTLAGDRLSSQVLQLTREINDKIEIANEYGVTESSVLSTIHRHQQENAVIHIGKPIGNTTVYIVDKGFRLQPVDIAGEICIGGKGVGRGYLNNPQLTRERFIPNPFNPDSFAADSFKQERRRPYSSLYLTGDLGKWLPGGNIQFSGRIDQQLKIRGYRIEPGEIENRLLTHHRVKETLVIARQDNEADQYLCAYIIPDPMDEFEIGDRLELSQELREHLAAILPDYMIPSYFLEIEQIPLTSTGKLDRKALPAPVMGRNKNYTAPGSEIEKELVKIWVEVLGGDRGLKEEFIGINDNFFERGGHSLKAITMLARVHKIFDVKVPLEMLFKRPFIKDLSGYIIEAGKERYAAVRAAEKKEYYVLSSVQERMYFLQQMQPDLTTYNLPEVIHLAEAPDLGKFTRTFNGIINRHESLRTSFHMLENQPVQRVHDELTFAVEYLTGREIRDLLDTPFDLSRSPLVRAGIVKLPPGKYLLVVVMHHIISDGVSNRILTGDFTAFFQGEVLSPLRIQYKDFSEWQHREKEKQHLKQQEVYWLNRFAGEIPGLNLPADFPGTMLKDFAGDFAGEMVNFKMGRENTRLLKHHAREHGVTLFMLLFAVTNMWLARLSGQEEIILGTPSAGRSRADLEQVIGMFVNTLALRHFPCGKKRFTEFLREVKDHTLGAFENQDYPFEELVERLQVQRHPGQNPLFDVMFTLDQLTPDAGVSAGVPAEANLEITQAAKFYLTLIALERGGNLFFTLQYRKKRFKKETIKRFISYFKKIITAILEDPGIQLHRIEILTEREKQKLLFRFNDTITAYPREKAIPQIFAEQVKQTPGNIAVAASTLAGEIRLMASDPGKQDMHLTYHELHRQSGHLASMLREKGVREDTIVALKVERSPEMIVAILGILKAGGAYLPIDPAYPEDRIDYMLGDSSAKVLVTVSSPDKELKKNPGSIFINSFEVSGSSTSQLLNFSSSRPSNLAYIIYTSGTTGQPRGILTTHTNVVRVVKETNYIEITRSDRLLQLSNYAFDGSVFDIFGALLNGAVLVLPDKEQATAVDQLAQVIENQQVNVFFVTTALFNVLTDQEPRIFKYVRKVLFGGERVSTDHVRKARAYAKKDLLVHVYGPTESTVFATAFPVRRVPNDAHTVPIGSPISNTCISILDRYLNLVPVGVSGELYIGGDGTARGYLNRPELTAELFCPNMSSFYKTGDQGRWLDNGAIEFLGRLDEQVKIRGFRIEPGEIEICLLKHPLIKEAVVIPAQVSKTANPHPVIEEYSICGYFVPEPGGTVTTHEIREYLSVRLPAYMVPAYLIPIPEIPLTPNKKVDRRALPAPGPATGGTYIAPRNYLEEELAGIWTRVLGIPRVGIDDNFFELGGHSLKATVLVSRIHKALDVKIPLAELFRTPSIRELAQTIKKSKKDEHTVIKSVEKREYYPLSSAQKRMYILQQMEKESTAYNMPEAIPLPPDTRLEKLEQVFSRLIRCHESLRTSFHIINGEPMQRVHRFDEVEFKLETGGHQPVIRSFDLSGAPLLRVELLKKSNDRELQLLLVDMHHIISDGISHQVLQRDFMALYNGEGLPPLPIQYKDFACWQAGAEQVQGIGDQASYWLEQFPGELPVLDLPLDFPRTPVRDFEGSIIDFSLEPGTLTALKKEVTANDSTLFMYLLAFFNVLLSRLSGQEDIIVGTPTAGRRHTDLENVLGMFVNTLAIRNFPGRARLFSEFLRQVREQTLDAFDNQDYSFEDLVERVKVHRDATRNPLFDVMFALDNFDIEEDSSAGISSTHPLITSGTEDLEIPLTAKFDLMLTALEHRDGLSFSFQYRTGLFKKETIERFISYFKNIVSTLVREPAMMVRHLEIMSAVEKQQLLYGFNDTVSPYDANTSVHQLLVEQVTRTPDSTAVTGSTSCAGAGCMAITYKELNRRAVELAQVLRNKAVGPDTIVAIMAERSLEMIIGILGILNSGGAYMPIEPESPAERIQYMLTDSGADILVTSASLEERTKKFKKNPEIIFIDSLQEFNSPSSQLLNFSTSAPIGLAYIIYTSGTTGRPKGVLVQHSNLTAYIHSFRGEFGMSPGDIVLQQASYCFDAFVEEVYPVLLAGGKLAVPMKEDINDIDLLLEFMVRFGVTIIDCSPLLLNELNKLEPETLNRMRIHTFISGGDELKPQYVDKLLKIGKVYNTYGPTEATVCAAYYRCSTDLEMRTQGVPLGSPISNYNIYILDLWLGLLPVGVPGELCISGPGLARGYLNRPELTSKNFLLDTNNQTLLRKMAGPGGETTRFLEKSPPGRRRQEIYKTGDRARWQRDGSIQFLGRVDRQVKIRGFRIEPGEIENQLLKHKHIKEAVVMDREDKYHDKFLCAYWVSAQEEKGARELSVSELRDFLTGKLASYMIPSYFVRLEKIPLTFSGKVDYKLLPEPGASQLKLETAFVAPLDHLEELIVEAWKEVLSTDRIGTHDNFFDIGGNSLKIIRVSNRLTGLFGVKVPVVDLFKYPTIRSLKEYLQIKRGDVTVQEEKQEVPENPSGAGTAVIGLAGKFPGAANINQFWENLEKGIESLSFFTCGELEAEGVSTHLLEDPNYVRVMGIVEDKDRFDAAFFNYTPQEARVMDPQMRLFHECVWGALEDGGYNPDTYEGSIGLYAGASKNIGWEARVRLFAGDSVMNGFEIDQLVDIHFIPARISYKLDLKGPGVFVQTACSTSLTAIHDACNAILAGDCNMALAGGVSLYAERKNGYLYEEGMIFSPDGHCRAFDSGAAGTTWGEGAAVVLLKPFERAVDDRDHIYAVIKATAANNDGNRKVGFSAPSINGQAETIASVHRKAGIPPESITYIEAHGTGTVLGDPIEIEALKQAFNTRKKGYCAVGSVKSNVGHLDCAAGAAGFIKAVLALTHKQIPPTLYFKTPNQQIDLIDSPFYINTSQKHWENGAYPRRAGVSSFGIGGTNAHVVLEEWPAASQAGRIGHVNGNEGRGEASLLSQLSDRHYLLLLSARTGSALERMKQNLSEYFKRNQNNHNSILSAAAYTLQLGRKAFNHRWTAVCSSVEEAVAVLDSPGSGETNIVRPGEENQAIENPVPAVDRESLTELGRKWLRGKPIQWEELYAGNKPDRVSLPTYPFEGELYWIDEDPFRMDFRLAVGKPESARKSDMVDWFYFPRWVSTPPVMQREGKPSSYCFLVFINESSLVKQVVRSLGIGRTGGDHRVVTVSYGEAYTKVNPQEFLMNPLRREDYRELLKELKRSNLFPGKIIHTWNVCVNDETGVECEGVGPGFYSLLYLAAALGQQDFGGEIGLDVLTVNAREVTGHERLNPGKAVVFGPLKVIPQEYPYIVCRSIDIELPVPGSVQEEILAGCLVNEFYREQDTLDTDIAYRGSHRWVMTYEPFPLPDTDPGALKLRDRGVYLITGGCGQIGFTLGEYLVQQVRARLVLTGRTPIPEPGEWEQWLKTHEADDMVSRKIEKIRQLQAAGGEVLFFAADVADKQAMAEVVSRAEQTFGPIDGIIHAAGVTTGKSIICSIEETGEKECQQQFGPKIQGTQVLAALFQDRPIDFCLLTSSLSPILGGLGFAAYSAANAFMDVFAYQVNRRGLSHWISVNWADWGENTGGKQEKRQGIGATAEEFSITPAEGAGTFARLLSLVHSPFSQVVVSSGDLQTRIDRWVKLRSLRTREDITDKAQERDASLSHLFPRPQLSNQFTAPRTQLEETIAGIWQQQLGFAEIGIRDDFFELGGDSLKAITMISKIHKDLNARVRLSEFFSQPIIESLVRHITAAGTIEFESIRPVERREYYALSSVQGRLYVLEQMEDLGTSYNLFTAISLSGELDKERLQEVFTALIMRHEGFRTSFEMVGGVPVQRIHEMKDYRFQVADFCMNPGSGSHIDNFIEEFIHPFDLSRTPLIRAGLCRAADNRHILIVDMHHIISDGISHQILETEFMALYANQALPRLMLHYKDYSEWENSSEQQAAIKKQEAFWLKELGEELPVPDLPFDFPRPAVRSFSGGALESELTGEETRQLNEMARSQGATLFIVLIAAFNIFLSKLSRQEDILVGIPTAGRWHSDLEKIIGMFVNTLVLRNYPLSTRTFREFLLEVKERTFVAFENQDYPFDNLVERLVKERDTRRNPLFDVMFVLQSQAKAAAAVPGESDNHTGSSGNLNINPLNPEKITSPFDLVFEAVEMGDRLCFSFNYCSKLFMKETIARYITYFKKIISTVIENPGIKLSKLDILPEDEKKRLLIDFNLAGVEYPADQTLPGLFSGQAERNPDHIALVGQDFKVPGGVHLTYRELDNVSLGLAGVLAEKGASTGSIVGLLVERSLEMVIGILGILKSGAAYLPMDPGNPVERTRYMLADSNAEILVTTGTLLADSGIGPWVEREDFSTIIIGPANSFDVSSSGRGLPESYPENLAYIIYTSGSTGIPKGVPITYSNLSPLMHWGYSQLGICWEDRVIQNLSYYFDWSVWEIFIALTGGASLIIPTGEYLLNSQHSIDFIYRNRITVLHATPTQYQYLLEMGQRLETLTYLFIGAEKLTLDLVRRSIDSVNENCRVFNMYGPTEATIISAVLEIDRSNLEEYQRLTSIPIGVPAGNTQLLILDNHMNLCPIGVSGELYISGDGVAPGYLNNPGLTLERFINYKLQYTNYKQITKHKLQITNQYVSKSVSVDVTRQLNKKLLQGVQGDGFLEKSPPGCRRRQYKTGDLARWLVEGTVEFLGRLDTQVKIRGFRIELGEIENRLLEHEGIQDVVVATRELKKDEDSICAYVVLKDSGIFAGAGSDEVTYNLKEYLSGKLPNYMIPVSFTCLEVLPLNPNGKVNLAALPVPGVTVGPEYTAPRNRLEEKLADIWSEVLGIEKEQIGIDDSFFELGGHSLKAAMVISGIHKELHVKVPLMEIFENPEIRELSGIIKELEQERFIPLQAVEQREYYELSYNQQRLHIIYQLDPKSSAYHMPGQMVLHHAAAESIVEKTFQAIAVRHESLRTSFKPVGDRVVQVIAGQVEIPFKTIDISEMAEEERLKERDRVYAEVTLTPFDISRAPIFRSVLLKIAAERFELIYNIHHIISDGWSMAILEQEFSHIYRQFQEGRPGDLEPLQFQYKDFSLWSNRQLSHPLVKQVSHRFWKEKLDRGIPVLELQRDFAGDRNDKGGGGYRYRLDHEQKELLERIVNDYNTSLFIVMFSVYLVFLYRFSGQPEIACSFIASGREHLSLYRMIGFFVQSVVFNTPVKEEESFEAFLRRVHEHIMETLQHQSYPLEQVCDELKTRYPEIPVSFNMLNIQEQSSDQHLESFTPYHIPEAMQVKFDLESYVTEYQDGIDIFCNYRKSMFKPQTIEFMIKEYIELLEFFSRDPGKSYSDYKQTKSGESIWE